MADLIAQHRDQIEALCRRRGARSLAVFGSEVAQKHPQIPWRGVIGLFWRVTTGRSIGRGCTKPAAANYLV